MSTSVIENPKAESGRSQEVRQLVPVLGSHWQLSWPCVAVVGWFALVFLLINHTPLSLAHTWKHANAGHWVSLHGSLPAQSPGVPLADGMPGLADSWLFDCLAAATAGRLGPEAVSALIAVTTSIALWLWSWLVYRASRSVLFVLFSAIVISIAWSSSFGTFQPRALGAILFAMLGWLVMPARPFGKLEREDEESKFQLRTWRWLAVGTLFAIWANLDISFVIGLLILAAIVVGHVVDRIRLSGLRSCLSADVVQWVWMLQMSVIATALTPHHLRLWHYCVTDGLDHFWAKSANGGGMYLPTVPGAAMMGLLGFAVWRFAQSTTKRTTSEVLCIIVVAVITVLDASQLFWLAPITMVITGRHWLPVSAKKKLTAAPVSKPGEDRPLRFAATLACLVFIWCGFALAPISAPILGGSERPHDMLFAKEIPRDLSVVLCENASASSRLVWAPADWADWLLWDGPTETRVFTNSELEHLPRQVQQDYSKIFQGVDSWDRLLDRYAVGTLIVDRARQPVLAKEALRSDRWMLIHQSPLALVLRRVEAGGNPS